MKASGSRPNYSGQVCLLKSLMIEAHRTIGKPFGEQSNVSGQWALPAMQQVVTAVWELSMARMVQRNDFSGQPRYCSTMDPTENSVALEWKLYSVIIPDRSSQEYFQTSKSSLDLTWEAFFTVKRRHEDWPSRRETWLGREGPAEVPS